MKMGSTLQFTAGEMTLWRSSNLKFGNLSSAVTLTGNLIVISDGKHLDNKLVGFNSIM